MIGPGNHGRKCERERGRSVELEKGREEEKTSRNTDREREGDRDDR